MLSIQPDIYAQSYISGHVTNLETSTPFQFVTVKAIGYYTYTIDTDSTGYYTMMVDTGDYELIFSNYGYDSIIVNTYVPENSQIIHNADLKLFPLPPATVSSQMVGNTCYIEYTNPLIPNEIIYDD